MIDFLAVLHSWFLVYLQFHLTLKHVCSIYHNVPSGSTVSLCIKCKSLISVFIVFYSFSSVGLYFNSILVIKSLVIIVNLSKA